MTSLGYCMNVHPIEEPGALLDALSRYAAPVARAFGHERFHAGLWLSRKAATALAGEPARLRDALAAEELRVVTWNGFPYGNFHAERVKEAVYRPDWADPARAAYTIDLAGLLTKCLDPDAAEGTISTLPLTDRREDWEDRVTASAQALARIAVDLDRLAQESGRPIRVCVEPEPGCAIETTDQAIRFFTDALPVAAATEGVARELLDRHLGLCFDACHQSVEFEDPEDAWKRLRGAGVPIGKIQISCALEVAAATADEARSVLAPFDEPRFLHQTRRRATGGVEKWMDLPEALSAAPEGRGDWRTHFHVPIHWDAATHPGPDRQPATDRDTAPARHPGESRGPRAAEGIPASAGMTEGGRPYRTTGPDLERLLAVVSRDAGAAPHLEVETYTWSVLPESHRPTTDAELIAGIVRELEHADELLGTSGAEDR